MKSKITLLARIGGDFLQVEIRKGVPVPVDGATSYYARFTKDGKRTCQPLGKHLASAFVAYQNLEMSREFESRHLPVPAGLSALREDAPRFLLSACIDKYLVETKDNKARKTWQAYSNALGLFVRSCKRRTVEEVTREDMLAFKTFLRNQRLSERSIWNYFLHVMVFLKWAGVKTAVKKDDWPRKQEREPEEYTEEEIKALLSAAENGERLVLQCFLCSALRSGELAHLTYGDIDFKHSVWTVRPKSDWATKTENSQRDVPVPAWLTAKLEERMKAGNRAKDNLIFFNRDGGPDQCLLRIVKRVAARAGVTGRVDDHKFRSTAITRWLRDGNSVQDVMLWVGHKDLNTILRYAAKLNVRKAETLQKASGAFAQFQAIGD